jgi:predicted  nucleic acid-binding Zn-ribbon protein
MQLSTPEGSIVEAEAAVRNLTQERARPERAESKRSDLARVGSLREFLDLRLALHEKDKEILRLHAQSNDDLKARLALEEVNLRHRREKTEAVDHALSAERALYATETELGALRSELGNAQFHLMATRAELAALHVEFTAVQNELGDNSLRLSAVRAELRAAQSELACAASRGVGPG